MAITVSNEYDHIDVVNGSNTNRHYIKDATARADIGELQAQMEDMDLLSIQALPLRYGIITQDAKWGQMEGSTSTYDNYRHILVPIKPGDIFSMTGCADGNTYWAVLQDYTPVQDQSASDDLSEDYPTRMSLPANGSTGDLTAPKDAKYLMLIVRWGKTGGVLNDRTPASLVINGWEYTQSAKEHLIAITDIAESAEEAVEDVVGGAIPLKWEPGTLQNPVVGQPWSDASSGSVLQTRKRTIGGIIRYPYPTILSTTEVDGVGFKTRLFVADADDNHVKTYGPNMGTKYINANQGFRIALELDADSTAEITSYTDEDVNKRVVLKRAGVIKKPVEWIAMGDSITQGYSSYWVDVDGTPTGASTTENFGACWAPTVAIMNGWNLTNIAIGGTGFIHWDGSNRTEDMAGFRVARATDFRPYDLVTVSFGINDWKGNKPLGYIDDSYGTVSTDADTGLPVWTGEPTTIYGGIKAVLNAIMASNPNCRIVVTTPLNALGYVNSSTGNYAYVDSERYALTYSYKQSGTLEDVFQAIVRVCEMYGIPYIDLTHKSPINMMNIFECLPDGIHPSLGAHKMIAGYMAGALQGTGEGESPTHDDLRRAVTLADIWSKGEIDLSTMQQIAASGHAPEVFEIGQVLTMPWTDKRDANNEVTYQAPVVITHFGDAMDGDGVVHHNAIFMQWLYATPYAVVFSASGSNRYSASDMRTWLNSAEVDSANNTAGFLSGVPEEWLNIMKPVRVKTIVSNGDNTGTEVTTSTDRVFIPSIIEMYGAYPSSWTIDADIIAHEGPYWEYWKDETGLSAPANGSSSAVNAARLIPKVSAPEGAAVAVRLRSAAMNNTTKGYIVSAGTGGGYLNGGASATTAYATIPSFVVY